jgi:putative membrane protein
MLARWCLAAIHLLAFGFAFASVFGRARARALRQLDPASSLSANAASLKHVFRTDAMWGLAALVLLVTGVMRAFGGFEKGGAYYLHEPLFHLKMTALVVILLIEIAPMMALIRWRGALGRGGAMDLGKARKYAAMSAAEAGLMIVMVIAATGMARGIWAG